ncbi:MAG: hypothetical protein HON94_17030 [Methylococcales bacterium]|jgi:hypothetical protein|nr:hypothetical protein [Methylococcales bacterium]
MNIKFLLKIIALIFVTNMLVSCGGSQYRQQISTYKSVQNVKIDIEKQSGIYWKLMLANNTEGYVKILWDDSAYVMTDGTSSRLIRGKGRSKDVSQSSSPVPSEASFSDLFTAEALIEKSSRLSPKAADAEKNAKLYLALDVNGRSQIWEAKVFFHKAE